MSVVGNRIKTDNVTSVTDATADNDVVISSSRYVTINAPAEMENQLCSSVNDDYFSRQSTGKHASRNGNETDGALVLQNFDELAKSRITCVGSSIFGEDEYICDFIKSELLLFQLTDSSRFLFQIVAFHRNTVESIRCVNHDVTALVMLVCNVTNGYCYVRCSDAVLASQAEVEKEHLVRPAEDSFLEGKELVTCDTAAYSFTSIVDTLGVELERGSATELMETVRVVQDEPSALTSALINTVSIKHSSKVVGVWSQGWA